ncbi:MAG TPA: PilW family protein [Caldimonas sp.]|jgi:type IV pilus assembly protein PilW|nr:PilW family protein [Caldimonas sp.]HEX4235896.1 PilW family protein [Caldimonas sp.]
MAAPRHSLRSPRRQRGMTLVELMVGLTLGLVVVSSLLLVLAHASTRGQDLQRTQIQIENGRYVAELFREDFRMAGFFGETSVAGALYTQPDPCSTAPVGWNGAPLTFPAAVQGYGAGDVLACLANRRAGTDAIVIRHVSVDATDPATIAVGNSQFYVQYSYCVGDVASPRLVFSTDHTAFTLRNRACTGVNLVRAYVSRIYYVADCNRCGVGGDTTPTLKRVDLVGNQLVTTPLAEGIELLRFEYGFDVDGDGAPDTYLTALGALGPTSSWSNVVALKAHFITRSLDHALGDNLAVAQDFQLGGIGVVTTAYDGYTRKAYSSAIRLVNPSAARESQ